MMTTFAYDPQSIGGSAPEDWFVEAGTSTSRTGIGIGTMDQSRLTFFNRSHYFVDFFGSELSVVGSDSGIKITGTVTSLKLLYSPSGGNTGDAMPTWDVTNLTGIGSTLESFLQPTASGTEIELKSQVYNMLTSGPVTAYGTPAENILVGGQNDDYLDGRGGADKMYGLRGNDTYIVDNTGDETIENSNGPARTNKSSLDRDIDTIFTSVSYKISPDQQIEKLYATNASGIDGIDLDGNAFAQTIRGNAGSNVIKGRGGGDVMIGLGGDDTYYIYTADDKIFEDTNRGTDTLITKVSYSLSTGQSIENMFAFNKSSTNALNLTGNELSQTIKGNAGSNVLDGGGGSDTLIGLGGNDLYLVDNAGDKVTEAAGGGTDRVISTVSYALTSGQAIEFLSTANSSGTAAIKLTGDAFAQTIQGNAGNNGINGGLGNDTLIGLAGVDTFVFSTRLGKNNVDHIEDFNTALHTKHDVIKLVRSVFTELSPESTLSPEAFKDISKDKTSIDTDDRILYNQTTGALFYDADGSGANNSAVQFAILDNKATLTHADFIIV